MRLISGSVGVLAFALVGLVVAGRPGLGAVAQDATPAVPVGHPLVGSWLVVDVSPPEQAGVLYTFFADGNVVAFGGPSRFTWHGTWVATGERAAAVTLVTVGHDEGTFVGTAVLEGRVQVDEAGTAFRASSTWTERDPAGNVRGSVDLDERGTRITTGPAGTPAAATPPS